MKNNQKKILLNGYGKETRHQLPKTTLDFLQRQGNHYLEQPAKLHTLQLFRQFEVDGSRQSFEEVYFDRRKRLTCFGLLSYLYPSNENYFEALSNEIWQVLQEFTWCLPAHIDQDAEEQAYQTYLKTGQLQYTIDLFAAETAFTLAEMLFVFQDRLSTFFIDKVKIEIDRRVLANFERNGSFAWETAKHNWAAVCAGSIGSAAIYLIDNEKRLSSILDRVLTAMESYLEGFEEDGACTEGYGYWQYGFGYFIYFLDLLEQKTGESIDLLKLEKVHNIAQFQQKIFLSKNHVVNFSDATPEAKPMLGFTHYLHKQFDHVHLPSQELGQDKIIDHCGRWAPAFREIIWYDSDLNGGDWPEGSVLFEHSSIIISRTSYNDTLYAFAAKGGHNDEAHNHNDIGHFILFGGEEAFLKDLGAGQYSKAYFGNERYHFICNSGEGHSIPVINGQSQLSGQEYRAELRAVNRSNDRDLFQLNMKKAYADPTLLDFERNFVWEKTKMPTLTVTDYYQFNTDPSSVIETFILKDTDYEITEDYIEVKGEEQSLKICYDAGLTPEIERKSFINHYGEKEFFLRLQLPLRELKRETEVTFIFQFC